jgi:small subunit ribosomal protein S24e
MLEKLNKKASHQVNTARGNIMEIQIISQKENPLLKRKEVQFNVEHEPGSTPPRQEVRRAVATALKSRADLVFVKKFETKTGTHTAIGTANLYESIEQAQLIEPEYIVKRNVPPEKPKEEAKEK